MSRRFNNTELSLINEVRRRPNSTKTEIASRLNLPWTTVSTTISRLKVDYDIQPLNILENPADDNQKQKAAYRAPIVINKNFEHYVGISIGTSNISMVFLDFTYSIIKDCSPKDLSVLFKVLEKYNFNVDDPTICCWTTETPDTANKIYELLKELCEAICELKTAQVLNISAITLTFPGHIDYEEQKIISAANLCNGEIKQANISRLITSSTFKKLEDNRISVYIDHNVKSCTIAEQEYLCAKSSNKKNMIVIYLGKGVGIGMILNNTLYRGNHNLAGQFGDIEIISGDIHSNSYHTSKLENIIYDIFFNKNDHNFKKYCGKDLKDNILHNASIEKKQELVNLLAFTLKNVISILGIEDIVFSGQLDYILGAIETDLSTKLEELNCNGIILHHSNYGEYSAAIGAAISCFHAKYEIPFEW